MSTTRIAAVTGANKGIGLAIVRQLALQYPNSPFHSGSFLIYLTARSAERGAEAVKTLNNDPELKKAKVLVQDGGQTTIKFKQLDISKTDSIRQFKDYLHQEHPDGIDILINNAGIALKGFDGSIVKQTLETNYYGTLEATQTILPIIKQGGRLVNVASMAGHLNKYSDDVRQAFLDASAAGVPEMTSLMETFKKAAAQGTEKEQGWPSAAYAVSKAGVIGMTYAISQEQKASKNPILINSCCPGYVETDMTGGGGSKKPNEGAMTPVLLALRDIKGSNGKFWQHEKIIEW
ncbi:NAD(P)-binding protein [Myriangium duriaei CBS 260.36]|uniref:NAD(P)-binding protein n=1 Tax=Myriangium duriaei CBS 260.36 TaxID=1168546 RepID=A0A9P4MMX0_9PEZI|nr:NAD(P)-binding protein [Myriangium duriaei CBS 260.36]